MSEAKANGARTSLRRPAVILAVALVIVVLADVVVSAVGSQLRRPLYWPTWELQHKYDAISSAHPPYQIVFVGDSVLDSAADPSLMPALHGTAFNASLAGEPLPVLEDWATRIVVPRFHPSTVVLGLNINVLSDPNHDQAGLVQLFQRSRPVAVAEGRGDVLDHLDGWLNAHVGIYKYRSVLRQPFKQTSTGGTPIYNPPLSASGWNEGFRAGVQSAAAAALDQEALTWQLDPARLSVFSEFVSKLHDEGVKVDFVMMPVSSAYLSDLPGGRPSYEAAVSDMVQRADAAGAQVLQTGEWPAQFFADASHLNGAGAAHFSTWIDQKLG